MKICKHSCTAYFKREAELKSHSPQWDFAVISFCEVFPKYSTYSVTQWEMYRPYHIVCILRVVFEKWNQKRKNKKKQKEKGKIFLL